MKKTIFLLITFFMFTASNALAYTWTDNNGVTWTFSQRSYTINGTSQNLWTIDEVSGYGTSIVVPNTVYYDNTAYTVEAIGDMIGEELSTIPITLPATIKYFECTNSYHVGVVKLLGTTPPVLYDGRYNNKVFEGITFTVPSSSLSTYRNADTWSKYAHQIISSSATTSYTVTASAMSNGSGILAAVGERNLDNVMTLKVSGTINSYDFYLMREKMPNLHYLNLTDASIVANDYCYSGNKCSKDNVIGEEVFKMDKFITLYLPNTVKTIEAYGCSSRALKKVSLPAGLETIGNYAFSDCKMLTAVSLQQGLKSIGDYAFQNCTHLTTVSMKECQTLGISVFKSCSSLTSITIPEGVTLIPENAFQYCKSLTKATLPVGVTGIKASAFDGCSSLKSISLSGVTYLEDSAFDGCTALTSITLPNVLTKIGRFAFYKCSSLTSIKIPDSVTSIGYAAFSYCTKLASVTLSKNIESIAGYHNSNSMVDNTPYYGVFDYCTSLTSINLQDTKLTKIGLCAFRQCTSLTEIRLPATLRSIGGWAFDGCPLQNIYSYAIEMPSVIISKNEYNNRPSFSCWTTAKVYVPTFAYGNYYFDEDWAQFTSINKMSTTTSFDLLCLAKDFTFDNQTGVVNGVPDADLNAGSGLVVNLTGQTLQLDEVHMAHETKTIASISSKTQVSASIIANNNLSAEKLYFDIAVDANTWYFLSFPFSVKLANTKSPGDFVFRYYDGQTRATNGGRGWKNVTSTYLNAGQGYIYCTNATGTLSVMVEKADIDFSGIDRSKALTAYSATDTKNASWNFIGNMHPCYFDIAQTGYTAPITVWNGSSYVAKRAGDDQYSLSPFQAFFVQKPSNVNQMSFPAAGRYTKTQWDNYVASQQSSVKGLHAPGHSERAIVNLTIYNGEDVVDETRVVFNAATSTDYEMDCDAAKFMSDQPVPQLYTLGEDGTQYAINERPAGKVTLCYVAPSDGELSISAPRMDQPVYLQDNVLGITHDLSLGAYTFTTEAGTFENRFVLRLNNPTTGIADMSDEIVNGKAANDQWFDLQGCQHNGTHLPKGLYVVKSGAKATKVVKQ